MSDVLERFLRYIAVDTQSEPDVERFPSTEKQKGLAELLAAEMKAMGIAGAGVDANGYVTGTIPSNSRDAKTVLGLIAHMDTSPDISGRDIHPRVVKAYDGGDILLDGEKGIVLSPRMFESLSQYVGQDLVVTDGSTLLGGDDKAGVAEILSMAKTLMEHPEIPHGTVKIAFTPDEEVGRGADFFDVKAFGADVAYTVDGGESAELEYENFNAASARVAVNGVNIHPGSAKNKMKNSLEIAMEFHGMLPAFEKPQNTEGYEGFSHLNGMSGTVERTDLEYIIRDHDMGKFGAKKMRFEKIEAYLNEKYGEGTVELSLTDSYFNMKEQIEPHRYLIDVAREAMARAGVTAVSKPVRGGTDGARLSYMGLPCPNLGVGGHNCHGRFEYVCVQSMEKTVEILLNIVQAFAGR
ncbi:MAG: peptidase T [Oscillospiraceae bacterium]|nr:peptidase T [Oscillospiraceae bacterium]